MAGGYSRRKFVKIAAASGVMLTAGSLIFQQASGKLPVGRIRKAPGGPMPGRYVMVLDLDKCDGCGKCTAACNVTRFVPKGHEWIKVFKVDDEEHESYFVRPCQQCQNPPCANVCPVGASFVREDGVVLIDHTICIGCRMCLAACPYHSRYFNWEEPAHTPEELAHTYSPEQPWPHRKGVSEKCDFCTDHAARGEIPPCASACNMGVIYYGDRYEDVVKSSQETVTLSEMLQKRHARRFKEELGTEPNVYYLQEGKV